MTYTEKNYVQELDGCFRERHTDGCGGADLGRCENFNIDVFV